MAHKFSSHANCKTSNEPVEEAVASLSKLPVILQICTLAIVRSTK